MKRLALLVLLTASPTFAADPPQRRAMTLDDLARLETVSSPQLSPDGAWVAYTVRRIDAKEDRRASDLTMTSWDGAQTVQLTFTKKESEHAPRFSPDGRWLAFLSSRGDDHDADQLWLLPRRGGEAEKVTDLLGGISDYAFSPDGARVVLVARDPDPDDAEKEKEGKKKTKRPIVVDRYYFKEDETGYYDERRQHLYLLDLASRKAEPLTKGGENEILPAFSPDGRSVAYVARRDEPGYEFGLYLVDAKPGASPRLVTSFVGDRAEGDQETPPVFSPDGKLLAYLERSDKGGYYFAPKHVMVVPAAGGTPRRVSPADRFADKPRFSADGAWLTFLLEEDRVSHLARVPLAGGAAERMVTGSRVVEDYAAAGGHLAVLSGDALHPSEVYAVEGSALRQLSRQNDALMAELRLAPVEETSFKSKDGTEIHGFLLRPLDAPAGARSPALLRIHGGPVGQFAHRFNPEQQLFAANGYAVIACNPRGSSGRGLAFARAIFASWGDKDAEDVLAAVDDAVRRGIADPERLGIGGWSYGGILTNYVISRDRRFKAATSGAGISNFLAGYGTDQYTRDYEAELGQPWKSPETYLRVSSPFLHADRIVTPTLFLCGEKDFNVPLLNSEQMYQALRSLGVKTRLVIYPGQFHEIRTPSYVRDRMQRYLDWYGEFLRK